MVVIACLGLECRNTIALLHAQRIWQDIVSLSKCWSELGWQWQFGWDQHFPT